MSGEIIHRYEKGIGLGMTGAARYENQEFEAHKGDMLILYSDGLIETCDENMQMRDAGFFENLIAESIKSGALSPYNFATGLLEKVRAADHSSEMEDDSSIIVINI
jgi:serine phosphatase RsbU (regulator of sigma subunit)